MRDKNRIPKILNELERIWKANPDFRLGQLMVIATKPKNPCPSVFNIEDKELLKGLVAFENREQIQSPKSNEIPDWKKFPNVSRIKLEEITIELLEEMITAIKFHKKNIVITPINLMKLNGAPVLDNNWILSQKLRRKKIKNLLVQLSEKGILEERKLKQDFLGMKEVGYNLKE